MPATAPAPAKLIQCVNIKNPKGKQGMSRHELLETRILNRLRTLNADDMQRLAERYACLRFPDPFAKAGGFRAFSAEGKSRAGWPDRAVFGPDNKYWHGVEATSAKDKHEVARHLREDLEKARAARPGLASFVFVSGHPEAQFSREELQQWHQRFAEQAGLEGDQFRLIYAQTLAHDLAEPKYARLRWVLLGIPSQPKLFKPVDPKVPWDASDSPFIPSAQEYKEGKVHRPELADRVADALTEHGLALVRGIGASGKTVLARLLALDAVRQDLPAYYLDLARYDAGILENGELLESLNQFGHPEALFILDNVHLDELRVAEVLGGWDRLDVGQRPKLLMLGRELRTQAGSPIQGLALDIPVLTLRAQQPEVLGVYLRLAARHPNVLAIPQPPAEVLDDWVRTFGGSANLAHTTTDLIAFSAAVLKRLSALLREDWHLAETDAVEQIREHYLKHLNKSETHNLKRLALLGDLEMALNYEALADWQEPFDIAHKQLGLVFREQIGQGHHTRYRLAHAALGRLLLAAIDRFDAAAEMRDIALAYPFSGFALAGRLKNFGQIAEAKDLLQALLGDAKRLLELGNSRYLLMALRLVENLEVGDWDAIAQVLAHESNHDRLAKMILATPFHFLANFLQYIELTPYLKSVFAAIAKALAEPGNQDELVRRALATPFHFLTNFLQYAERTPDLKAVFIAIAKSLGGSGNRDALERRALESPLGELKAFLEYTGRIPDLQDAFTVIMKALFYQGNREEFMLWVVARPSYLGNVLLYAKRTSGLYEVFVAIIEALYVAGPLGKLKSLMEYTEQTPSHHTVFVFIAKNLAEPSNRDLLARRAVASPLGDLKAFLEYADLQRIERVPSLQAVSASIKEALSDPDNRGDVARRALASPLDELQSFLIFAEAEMRPVWEALRPILSDPENCKRLATHFTAAPLDQLVSLLKDESTQGLWLAVLAEVDSEEWNKQRLLEKQPKVDAFVAFQHLAQTHGRAELAQAPALSLIRTAKQSQWHMSGIGLHYLSHALRCAKQATDSEIGAFLEQIATGDWLDGQIRKNAGTGALAGFCLSLAVRLPPQHRRHVLRPSLKTRVEHDLRICWAGDIAAWAEAISLLGAAALLGLRLDSLPGVRLSNPDLRELLRLRQPDPGYVGLGHLQIQLWLGLRELARLGVALGRIPAALGEDVLARWRVSDAGEAGQTLSAHVHESNAAMIVWLERCRANQWRLS